MCANVFDDNPQAIRFFIDVVLHLDECVNKISGETLAYVMKYTDCDCPSQTAFYDCFCETYQQVGGKNHVVSKQRFNQAYSEMIRGKFTAYDSFVTKIEMYLL